VCTTVQIQLYWNMVLCPFCIIVNYAPPVVQCCNMESTSWSNNNEYYRWCVHPLYSVTNDEEYGVHSQSLAQKLITELLTGHCASVGALLCTLIQCYECTTSESAINSECESQDDLHTEATTNHHQWGSGERTRHREDKGSTMPVTLCIIELRLTEDIS